MPAAAKIPVVLYCAFNGCGNRKAHGAGEGLGGRASAFEMSSPEPLMLFIPRTAIPRAPATGRTLLSRLRKLGFSGSRGTWTVSFSRPFGHKHLAIHLETLNRGHAFDCGLGRKHSSMLIHLLRN